ncbi:unnamed protein product [Anisakis simplex]|uniref:Formin_GBD_N domain-containing protein n=1 Tax=Anisakis simplex TaxID=6269 RepID=A0A0M3J8L4_ANISI|nr:unnamed protein product [Anisakis simplex]
MGDFGSYLDSDMSLMEQEDELEILKADPCVLLTFFDLFPLINFSLISLYCIKCWFI